MHDQEENQKMRRPMVDALNNHAELNVLDDIPNRLVGGCRLIIKGQHHATCGIEEEKKERYPAQMKN
jgi:hypothetical protein